MLLCTQDKGKDTIMTTTGLRYAITLVIVIGIIMTGAKIFNVTDPTWALISGVVCTELEIDQARSIVFLRIFATIIGVILACLVLLTIGPGYLGIMVGVLITTLICHYGIPIKNGWKLATATGLMVLVAGLQQHSIHFAETIAIKRAIEVIAGSLVAGIISFFSRYAWLAIEKN